MKLFRYFVLTIILFALPSSQPTIYTDAELDLAFSRLRQMIAINAFEERKRGLEIEAILGETGAREYYEYLDNLP